MNKLPDITAHYIEDCDSSKFLTLHRVKLRLEYPDGTMSEEFVHDIVTREKPDAVVIVPFDMSEVSGGGQIKVWLRSCIRPAISHRYPFPNTFGNGWELPAGLIDPGERPEEAAVRELREEVGFEADELFELGKPVLGCVGLSAERLFFYGVNVTGMDRLVPSEDGSPLERFGECALFSLEEARLAGDLKTSFGALLIKEFFAPFDKIREFNSLLNQVFSENKKPIEES